MPRPMQREQRLREPEMELIRNEAGTFGLYRYSHPEQFRHPFFKQHIERAREVDAKVFEGEEEHDPLEVINAVKDNLVPNRAKSDYFVLVHYPEEQAKALAANPEARRQLQGEVIGSYFIRHLPVRAEGVTKGRLPAVGYTPYFGVQEEWRRRGLGKVLSDRILAFNRERGNLAWIGEIDVFSRAKANKLYLTKGKLAQLDRPLSQEEQAKLEYLQKQQAITSRLEAYLKAHRRVRNPKKLELLEKVAERVKRQKEEQGELAALQARVQGGAPLEQLRSELTRERKILAMDEGRLRYYDREGYRLPAGAEYQFTAFYDKKGRLMTEARRGLPYVFLHPENFGRLGADHPFMKAIRAAGDEKLEKTIPANVMWPIIKAVYRTYQDPEVPIQTKAVLEKQRQVQPFYEKPNLRNFRLIRAAYKEKRGQPKDTKVLRFAIPTTKPMGSNGGFYTRKAA